MYALNQSWMGGVEGPTDEEIEAINDPWYMKTITGVTIGVGSVSIIFFGLYIFFETKEKLGLLAAK